MESSDTKKEQLEDKKKDWCEKNGLKHLEASSKTGGGAREALEYIAKLPIGNGNTEWAEATENAIRKGGNQKNRRCCF